MSCCLWRRTRSSRFRHSRLSAHTREALFGVGAAALLLLFIGIHNAWDAVAYHVFVNTRDKHAGPRSGQNFRKGQAVTRGIEGQSRRHHRRQQRAGRSDRPLARSEGANWCWAQGAPIAFRSLADELIRRGGKALAVRDGCHPLRSGQTIRGRMPCSRYGRIDVMINNAGLMPQSPLERLRSRIGTA